MPASNAGINTVAGYFAKHEDASRAIRELLDEGFGSNDIGAAFHSNASRSSGKNTEPEVVNDVPVRVGYEEREMRPAGATSGTEAVSPWGLFTGGGTPFAGASRPGPITGSDVPPTLPRELPSEFASEHDYSAPTFESSFSGLGIAQQHAQRLSTELGKGGAVVTVKAGARASDAEAVIERNHGIARYSSPASPTDAQTSHTDLSPRVRVFGEMHRGYSGKVPAYGSTQDKERKVS